MLAQLGKAAPMINDQEAAAVVEQRARSAISGEGIDDNVRAAAQHPLLERSAI
jgi:hypothetical protein